MENLANRIIVYTDGSNSTKSGFCGWGTIARWNNLEIRACGWAKGTNIFSELFAIIYTLRRIPKNLPLTIITDSEYSIKALTVWRAKWERNGFKNIKGGPIAYTDLVKEGHKLVDSFIDLKFVHVRGHTGVEGNEAADVLAKTARYIGEGKAVRQPNQPMVMEDGQDPDYKIRYSR